MRVRSGPMRSLVLCLPLLAIEDKSGNEMENEMGMK